MKPPREMHRPRRSGHALLPDGNAGTENRSVVNHERAMLPSLDHQRSRSHLENVLRCTHQVVLAGQLAGFVVIDHEDLRVVKRLAKLRWRARNPIVHGVEANHRWFAPNLLQHRKLELRVNISQKNMRRIAIGIRQRGLEIGEDIQIGRKGCAFVHVLAVAAGPEEALPRHLLQTGKINAPAAKDGLGLFP